MNTIAERITLRRKELNMTQKELAEKLEISDKTVSRWETGKQIPDALAMPEIAKALDIKIGELYGEEIVEENKEKEGNDILQNKERTREEAIRKHKKWMKLSLIVAIIGWIGTLLFVYVVPPVGSGYFKFIELFIAFIFIMAGHVGTVFLLGTVIDYWVRFKKK